jgi:hypothetical protein
MRAVDRWIRGASSGIFAALSFPISTAALVPPTRLERLELGKSIQHHSSPTKNQSEIMPEGGWVTFLGDGKFDDTELQADLRRANWQYVCRYTSPASTSRQILYRRTNSSPVGGSTRKPPKAEQTNFALDSARPIVAILCATISSNHISIYRGGAAHAQAVRCHVHSGKTTRRDFRQNSTSQPLAGQVWYWTRPPCRASRRACVVHFSALATQATMRPASLEWHD